MPDGGLIAARIGGQRGLAQGARKHTWQAGGPTLAPRGKSWWDAGRDAPPDGVQVFVDQAAGRPTREFMLDQALRVGGMAGAEDARKLACRLQVNAVIDRGDYYQDLNCF